MEYWIFHYSYWYDQVICIFTTELLITGFIVGMVLGHNAKGAMFCEFYNKTCADSSGECATREECVSPDTDKRNHCFVLWRADPETKEFIVTLKVMITNLICFV